VSALRQHDRCEEPGQLIRRRQRKHPGDVLVRSHDHDGPGTIDSSELEHVLLRIGSVDLLVVDESERTDAGQERLRNHPQIHAGVILLVDHLHIEPGADVGAFRRICDDRRIRRPRDPVGQLGDR